MGSWLLIGLRLCFIVIGTGVGLLGWEGLAFTIYGGEELRGLRGNEFLD